MIYPNKAENTIISPVKNNFLFYTYVKNAYNAQI